MPELPFADDIAGGSKLSLSNLKKRMRAAGIRFDEQVWPRIEEVVVKALLCGEDAVGACVNSFELFGFDVILDESLRPWLLENNSSPSLACETPLDHAIKPRLISDVINLVDPLPIDRVYLAKLLDRKLRTGNWPPAPAPAASAADSAKTSDAKQSTADKAQQSQSAESKRATRLAEHQASVDAHMQRVLMGRRPRLFGEMPKRVGGFRRLAPTAMSDQLLKMKRAAGVANAAAGTIMRTDVVDGMVVRDAAGVQLPVIV